MVAKAGSYNGNCPFVSFLGNVGVRKRRSCEGGKDTLSDGMYVCVSVKGYRKMMQV